MAGWLVGRLAAGWLAGYGTLISIVGLCVANCAGIVACKNTCINSPHFVVLAPKWVYVLLTPQSLPTHRPTLVHVHIYIYIYTSVDPCIYMHGAKQSRVQWLRAQCSRAQHFRIVISNSSLEQPLRTHRRHRSRLEQPLRAHWRHRAGSNSLFERLFEPFCAFLHFFEPF